MSPRPEKWVRVGLSIRVVLVSLPFGRSCVTVSDRDASADGILTGMIFCFEKAMSEFGATSSFVSNIPGGMRASAIDSFTRLPGDDAGAPKLTTVSVSIAMLALLASELMVRHFSRRLEIE